MTIEEFYQKLSFEEHTEWAANRMRITGRLAVSAEDLCDLVFFQSHEAEARDFHRRSIAKRIWDMLRREINGYSKDDLHFAYEMGARDGMFTGETNFNAVLDKINRRKGRS